MIPFNNIQMPDKAAIIKEAQKYLARGQVDKAIAEWEKLINESPDGNVYNTVGDLYLKRGDRKNAVDSFHRAAKYFREEGFSLKSVALYKKILNINPSDADALFALGELSMEKGIATDAIKYYKDAIKYYLTGANGLSAEDRKEKLLDVYNRILNLSPTDIPLKEEVAEIFIDEGLKSEAVKEYLNVAWLYDEKGDIRKAEGYFRKVLDVHPLNKEALMGLSYLYEKAGDIKRATKHMEDAATLLPHDTDILLRCTEIYMVDGRFDKAKECLRKVTEIEPSNINVKRFLGEIYIREGEREKAWAEYLPVLDEMILDGKYDDAIKLLTSFKDIDPVETCKRLASLYRQLGENIQAYNELVALGDVLVAKGMQKEALNCYKDALQIRFDDSLSARVNELEKESGVERISITGEKTFNEILEEAEIFLSYGLYEKARVILDDLRMKDPENIDVHLKLKSLYVNIADKEMAVTECLILHELYRRMGDVEKSEHIIKEAFEIYPEDPRLAQKIHYNLGIAYKETGLIDDAIREFQLSLTDPDMFIWASSMLGICYVEKGLYSLAIDALNNAIKNMEKKDEFYWAMRYNLAEAYERNGNLKEALDSYTEICEWNRGFRAVSDKINKIRAVIKVPQQEKVKGKKERISYL